MISPDGSATPRVVKRVPTRSRPIRPKISQTPNLPQELSTAQVLTGIALRLVILGTFAAFGSQAFARTFATLLMLGAIYCALCCSPTRAGCLGYSHPLGRGGGLRDRGLFHSYVGLKARRMSVDATRFVIPISSGLPLILMRPL